jgi:PAS domain S-box-containing protein
MTVDLDQFQKRVMTIFDTMPIGLIMTNNSGLIQTSNKFLQETAGYSAPDLLGKSLSFLFGDLDASVDIYSVLRSTRKKVILTVMRKADHQSMLVELVANSFEDAHGSEWLLICVLDGEWPKERL